MEDFIVSKELLEVCKLQVAAKFSTTEYSKWVNNDFIRLSDEIVEKTKSYLSPTSLKRIFGKINSEAFPKKSTLDILAHYIDYLDWQDFVTQVSEKNPDISNATVSVSTGAPQRNRKKSILVLLAIGAGLAGLLFIFLNPIQEAPVFSFTQGKVPGKAPFSATFKVDVSKLNPEHVVLDFSDPFETEPKFSTYRLSKETQTVTHTYMIPGVYHPHLKNQTTILDSLDVPVYSDGWEWVVVNYHEKERSFHTIKDQPYFRKEGIFCIPSTEVAKYKVDTMTSYCMRYLNYQDFNVAPDKLRLELKVSNPIISVIKCSDVEVQLKFRHWNVGFMLFHKGCNGNYSRVQLGSKVLNGIDNDLSMFEVDLNQWHTVSTEIQQGKVTILVNGKRIFEDSIEGDPGSFQGISISSQGSARLDYVRVHSGSRELLGEEF